MVEKFQVEVEIFECLFFNFPYTLLQPQVQHCNGFTKTHPSYIKHFFQQNPLFTPLFMHSIGNDELHDISKNDGKIPNRRRGI